MHRPVRTASLAIGLLVSTAFFSSCADGGTTKPNTSPAAAVTIGGGPRVMSATMKPVRFSEIHYDNASTDAQEAIEISAPIGEDLTGWSIVLYNGTGGASYDTDLLTGLTPVTCPGGLRKVVVVNYAVNGIQNGAPDGMALVNPLGVVQEFFSYEGVFDAVGGPANGTTATNIVSETGAAVFETGSEPFVDVAGVLKAQSLKRSGGDFWSAPDGTANSFGVCNDHEETPPPPPPTVVEVRIDPLVSPVVVGGTQTLTARAFDASDNEIPGTTFEWDSDNEPVATVSAGVVTGVTEGDATISATAAGRTGTILIHVDPAPLPPATPPRISEVHYDNSGTDAGERIEIEGPAEMNLTGWSVVLYNLTGGAQYNTQALTGTIPASCGDRGVVVVTYASNGIQNGPQDGIALVGPSGVVEFLSYEGTLTASNGPAAGMTSTDIGFSQNPDNSVPSGFSLQRDDAGWFGLEAQSFGACNTRPVQSAATIVINEVMSNPLRAVGGASWGEWFEVHNTGTAPVDLQGWTISSFGHPDHVIGSSVVVAPGGFSVLGRGFDPAQNGGITIDYNYFVGSTNTIFLDPADRLELRDAAGARVDMVRWTISPLGITRALRDASADNTNVDAGNWGFSTVTFGDGDFGTPRAANGTLSSTPPALPNFISFSGRTGADVPLPVGFQDQVFATLLNGSTGATIPTTFGWTSETPDIASVDQDGVFTALAPGTAILRATASDGTTRTHSLQTHTGVFSDASYVGNTEFGEPADADASDDKIVSRPQFTASYNRPRGIPNWVSFNLEATHFGAEDRCDCFTFDPMLPADFPRYTTADYTGGGAFIGPNVGLDRGHLARSFDRTSASLDNAATFYFTNIIPQFADNNQGPWALLENHLGSLAQNQNKELYVIAGASGGTTTVKNEGKITIPDFVWKVAVIMPRNQGLANIDSYDDVEIVSVIMPNIPGIRNVPWETYKKTVDEVEALSGYNLLALLADQVEIAVESGTRPPTAAVNGPFTSNEGESVSMSAAGSSDPDAGDMLTYSWNFGDGSAEATGVTATRTYAQNGNYTVTLTVTDSRGLVSTVTTTANVANVSPAITSFTGAASTVSGALYSATGTFSDPGVDDAPWGFNFAWGEGAPSPGTALSQSQVLAGSHRYLRAGTYTVRLTVTDRDGGFSFRDLQVQVGRLAVAGVVDPDRIKLKGEGKKRIAFQILSSATFDATQVDPASARIGSVAVSTKRCDSDDDDDEGDDDGDDDGDDNRRPSGRQSDPCRQLRAEVRDVNRDRRPDLILEFSLRELVATGALSLTSTELVLTADLRDGRQIVSTGAVRPR